MNKNSEQILNEIHVVLNAVRIKNQIDNFHEFLGFIELYKQNLLFHQIDSRKFLENMKEGLKDE